MQLVTFIVSGFNPMGPRDTAEAHRAATPLELLFDLVSVIAIAAAAAGLPSRRCRGTYDTAGIITFSDGFFAIWWAWMNYTWFASAYDTDDIVFRLADHDHLGRSPPYGGRHQCPVRQTTLRSPWSSAT